MDMQILNCWIKEKKMKAKNDEEEEVFMELIFDEMKNWKIKINVQYTENERKNWMETVA